MPDYSIYVLGESALTVTGTTGGNGLDGLTQGSGVHLLGATITIDTAAWQEILITDDDANFQDSDGGQRLLGSQTVDGTLYANGAVVEAEYGFTVSDGTNTWQLVGFNVNNSSPAYGTVEGIAVIGGPGSFPPAGVPLTVTATQEGPNFAAASYATPVCFDAETPVATGAGLRRMGDIAAGDAVRLACGRLAPVRWVGHLTVPALGVYAPVRFAPGAFGARAPVRVSQQHRVRVTGWRAELMFGASEVLVPARALVDGGAAVRLDPGGMVTYVHLLFDGHELLDTHGLVSESLNPGAMAKGSPMLALFPEGPAPGNTCLPALRMREGRLLAA